MQATLAILLLFVSTLLRAQPAAASAKQNVLILLRQPESALSQRLAQAPPSTPVPDEVRTAAEHEQTSLIQAQTESFEQRLTAAGATGVVHYAGLNMMRADIPPSALTSLHSDPAVVSVTPLSEDAPPLAGGAIAPPLASPGVAAPPAAGVAAGRIVRKSESFQPPSLMPAPIPGSMPAMPMPSTPGQPPGAMMPGQMMGSPPFGAPPPGMPGSGGMLQSILGVTGQMGMQAGTMAPRAAGMIAMLTGGAQIAQIVANSRKQGCAILIATAGAQIPEAGGQGVIAVSAPPTCLWQAQSDADWLQIDAAGPMMGPGIVKYTATAASHGMLRTGVVSITGVAGNKVKGKTSTTLRQGE